MKKITLLLLVLIAVSSCRDFLDIKPKGETIVETIRDYDQLLNGGTNQMNNTMYESIFQFSTDDYKAYEYILGDPNDPLNTPFQLYTWSKNRFSDPNIPNPAWNSAYQNIYTLNKIINEIDAATPYMGYTEADKARIKAEAKYKRAFEYLFLVNTFAKHYSTTASSDPGVPIVLIADVQQPTPSRGNVAGVYDQILQDLTEAQNYLPSKSVSPTRPNKGSGYALQARTYLYMGDYQKAKDNATMALGIKNEIADLTITIPPGADPMAIFSAARNAENYSFHFLDMVTAFQYGSLAPNLASMFEGTDMRLHAFYELGWTGGYSLKYSNSLPSSNLACSVSEMVTTLAECEVRLGNGAAAIELMNDLREKRIRNNVLFTVGDFGNNDEILEFVLNERRKEVFNQGIRLADIKRLNLDPRFQKTLKHVVTYGNNSTEYTAEPESNKLVLPIPASIMKFHTDWPQN